MSLPRVCLLSGAQRPRLMSHLGHKVMATLHGYDYRFEGGPFRDLPRGYFLKLAALREQLPRYDWVLWLDDDAFVTDPRSTVFTDAIAETEARDGFLFLASSCDEELNGAWAAVNTGVMGWRNDERSLRLIELAWNAPMDEVEEWWDRERYGVFTRGDQDALYWGMHTTDLHEGVHLVDPQRINSRPRYFTASSTDRTVCHFPGYPDKHVAVHEFARRFGLDGSLLPRDVAAEFGVATPPVLGTVAHARRRGTLARRAAAKRVRLKYDWVRTTRRWR